MAVHHRHGIVGAAHLRGAHRVEDGACNVAGQAGQLFVALELRAGLVLLRLVFRECGLGHDATGHAQAVGGHLAVFGCAQVERRDRRGGVGLRRGDAHMATAGGVEVAHAGGEGREAVQRLAKSVQAEWLHVVFDVGPGLRRVAAGEGAELAGRHAHGAAARERVFEPDGGLAPERVGQGVERFRALHLEHRADLQVVLQVGAHAGQVVLHRYAQRLQQRGRAHARELQDLRRADAARAEHHLFRAGHLHRLAPAQQLHAGAAQSAVGLALQREPLHLRLRPHREVGPLPRRAQKGFRGVPAPAGLLVHLEIAHAFVVAGVEVGGGGYAGLLRGLGERVEHVPAQALLFNAPLARAAQAAVAVQQGQRGVGHALVGGVEPVVVFVRLEVGQALAPRPAGVAGELRPLVVVPRLAAHVDHAVDAGAAAQPLAARVAQAAAVQARVGLGLVKPVGARVADAIQVTHRDVDPVVVVLAPGFDQQHAARRVGAQAVGQQAAGRAGADDDVIKSGLGHGGFTRGASCRRAG
ncbi:hypothetical protein FQZ97_741200 [compost metagenome]